MPSTTAKTMLTAQDSGLTWGQISEIAAYMIDRVQVEVAASAVDLELLDELKRLFEEIETAEEAEWTALKLKAFYYVASPVSPVVSRLAGAGRSPFVALSCLHYCADDVAALMSDPESFLGELQAVIQGRLAVQSAL